MKAEPLTPDQFDAALHCLGWKGSDFCERAGLVPNTVWRWRKALSPIPLWVGEYLRALVAIQRLQTDFLAPLPRTAGGAQSEVAPGAADDAGAEDRKEGAA